MTNRNTHPDFGIHAAALMALELFDASSRRTGRTIVALAGLEDGDLFLTFSPQHARQVEHELRGLGKRQVVVGHCASMPALLERVERARVSGAPRRIVLDHTVVHLLYREAIENTAHAIAHLTKTPPADPRLGPVDCEWAERGR